ncbi:MAG: RNase adapter RapZ [Steroidobacteraceae bacterium]
MHLVFVSGLSGAGKSVALHMLEDLDFYCIDNIPAALLKPFISQALQNSDSSYQRVAVGVDARNIASEITALPQLIDELRQSGTECELLFLQTTDEELLRRFAATRRKHPMSRRGESLVEAIALERRLLEPVVNRADLIIDTTRMSVHDLRDKIAQRIHSPARDSLSVLVESFGFKQGIPGDADFVFDARSLPNPYWEPSLRPLSGLDMPVAVFLGAQDSVRRFIDDVAQFVEARLPEYRASNRHYLTVAIGCTGGQHRSVYIAEQLAQRWRALLPEVQVRHCTLPEPASAASSVAQRA